MEGYVLDSGEITRRLVIWGVCAIAVLPRQHIDRNYRTVGGGQISHSFRKILLVCVGWNLLRFLCKLLLVVVSTRTSTTSKTFVSLRFLADAFGIIQIVSLTFLCFLTPYLLQTWLVTRVNLSAISGGRYHNRPGADLMAPLYWTAALSISGVALYRTVDSRFWALNRLANALTGPPVLRTLKLYNSVTCIGNGPHAGRGSILCQILVIVEWWHMITQFLCSMGFALKASGRPPTTVWEVMLEGFRDVAFTSGWVRVLVHAIFINLLDEISLTSPSSSNTTTTATGDEEMSTSTKNTNNRASDMVPLVSRMGQID